MLEWPLKQKKNIGIQISVETWEKCVPCELFCWQLLHVKVPKLVLNDQVLKHLKDLVLVNQIPQQQQKKSLRLAPHERISESDSKVDYEELKHLKKLQRMT